MVTADDAHRSIGEVLALLREEFPDITISKIRFLESQGLIDPERTPSGYRKFYETDVQRLRWILVQQREKYLPLKVIRGKLEQLRLGEDPDAPAEPAGEEQAASTRRKGGGRATRSRAPRPERAAPAAEPPEEATGRRPAARSRAKKRAAGAAAPRRPAVDLDGGDTGDDLAGATSGVSLTRAELVAAAGIDDAALAHLEEFGLVQPSGRSGDRVLFDDEALTAARLAAGFLSRGIEARHLRMYKTFAEREAVLFEQILLPTLRQRNPEARAAARDELVELARLGRGLRNVYLRQAAARLLAE